MTITAHTGCEGTVENTIESALAGISAGADFVEVDVRTTRDGVPVLSHDDGIASEIRDARISMLSLEELTHAVPGIVYLKTFFSEVLSSGAKVNLDIKDERSLHTVFTNVKEAGAITRVVITGCHRVWAKKITSLDTSLFVYLNTRVSRLAVLPIFGKIYLSILCRKTAAVGCRGINLHKRFFSRKLVRIAHMHGLSVSVWTVSERDGFDRFIRGGADNVTTKDVSALVLSRTAT